MKLFLKSISLFAIILATCNLCACRKESPAAAKTNVQALPRLLDLGAHKCIPCQKMAPILDELAKEYKGIFDVEFVDVWQPENKERAVMYKIETIPTQIFFDAGGKELWRHVGYISKEEILSKWQELGCDFKAPADSGR